MSTKHETSAQTAHEENPATRRNVLAGLLGTIGVTALAACASQKGDEPDENIGQAEQGLVSLASSLASRVGTFDGQAVSLLDHTKAGDGGGGTFIWTNTPPAWPAEGQNAMIFGSHASGARWVRVWSGHVNVRWFGAQGDGIGAGDLAPDGTPMGDAVRIQKAIDFCSKLKGVATVFFPAGAYALNNYLSNPRLQLKSNVNLLGCGPSSELVCLVQGALNTSLSARILLGSGINNVAIESLMINGQELAQPGSGNFQRAAIFIQPGTNLPSSNIRIQNCVIFDTCDGIRLFGGNDALNTVSRVRISGNDISKIRAARESINGTGIVRDVVVESNQLHDSPTAGGIKFFEGLGPPGGTPADAPTYGLVIRSNVLKNVGSGIHAKWGAVVTDNIIDSKISMAAQLGSYCQFTSNQILKGAEVGIGIGDYGTVEDVIVANNTIRGVYLPTNVQPGHYIEGINIVSNVVTDEFRRITVTGNIIENTDPNYPMRGIYLERCGTNISITNNQVLNVAAGIDVEGGTAVVATSWFRISDNSVTLADNGFGIILNTPAVNTTTMQNVVVIGNLVRRHLSTTVATTGLWLPGVALPMGVVLMGNNLAGTDQPYIPNPFPISGVGNIP